MSLRHCRTVFFQHVACVMMCAGLSLGSVCFAADGVRVSERFVEFTESYCADCHSGPYAEARLDLSATASQPVAQNLSQWRKVARVLKNRVMPPEEGEQLDARERQTALDSVDSAIALVAEQHADDPGPTVIRRLTSAEYDYCVEDLTGLRLNLAAGFVSDSVGGTGFTNSAAAQFMQDATLERYLEAAKVVADHAIIGAGPIHFYPDSGQTGMELSAINRIKSIYRRYGFRAAGGEGAEPYGLDRIPRAFHVAWKYRHRHSLGLGDASIEDIASESDIEANFARHLWNTFHVAEAGYPLSEIIASWRGLPAPEELSGDIDTEIARRCEALFVQIQTLQSRLAGAASAEEEAAVLAGGSVHVPSTRQFSVTVRRKRIDADDTFTPDINQEKRYSTDGTVRLRLSIEEAGPNLNSAAVVVFKQPQIRFRFLDGSKPDPVPLKSAMPPSAARALDFGGNPGGDSIAAEEFVLRVGESKRIEVVLPEGCNSAELGMLALLDSQLGCDSAVRCVIEDVTGDRRRTYSSLLRDEHSARADAWQAGIDEFAGAFPQISHREPAPSDRDLIPDPYDNAYNLPERNFFHTAVKYHREDQFLVAHLLSPQAVPALNAAWTDLLMSFDYHDVNFRFVARKFDLDIEGRDIRSIDASWIHQLPAEPRNYISAYKAEYDAMVAACASAEEQHLCDLEEFANKAWRRPLTPSDRQRLRTFYWDNRRDRELSHRSAIRATLVRILVSPDFLYRVEEARPGRASRALSSFELASRLSLSIWSSIPDDELRSLASTGKLLNEEVLTNQVRRMLESPKARRLATEFFGQWLGFYQFDRFRGVDSERFPEFDGRLKNALYEQAITYFEHVVREDRPYVEIIDSDYTYLDETVARHYGLPWKDADAEAFKKIAGPEVSDRGGVFGLGAVLITTSAPLRTSPVKRGDWILRRLLGTPVPPPPPDAGSIPADDVLADGKTVRERLEAHRNNAACSSCHVRIDPLGFALEHFDSLGRWRKSYRDGQPIDSSGVLADGRSIEGVAGLKAHLRQQDADFRRTLATKMIGYFLGRSESISDAALVDRVARNLSDDARFSTAVLAIVQSPQFRRIRSADAATAQITTDTPGEMP